MKTFIINTLKDALNLNKKLDSIALIQNKEWIVYTDEANITEKYIFLKGGKLINSINGISSYYKWEYIQINSSIIIENDGSTLLFKIVYCDKSLLILNLDGTQEFCFLINSTNSDNKLVSYEDIQWYLIHNSNIDILTQEQRLEYEEKKRREWEHYWLITKKEKEEEIQKQKETEELITKVIFAVAFGTFVIILISILKALTK